MSINVVIIGCGGMAGGHLNSYLKIKETVPDKVELVAMCDTVTEKAENFASKVKEVTGKKPAVYSDIDKMLENEDIDGADICTPHAYHHISAIKCLDAGVNVIVEKPIGITVKATQAIIDAAKRNDKIAATAENIRRMPSRRTAWWIMNEKKMLGDMRMFFSQQASYREPNPESRWHWRLDMMLGGGGMVMDSGAHFCDTIRYLYGNPDTVYAKVEQIEERRVTKDGEVVKSDNEDTWFATINFKSGATGIWTCTRAAPGEGFNRVVHYGSEGSLVDSGDIFHGPFDGAKVVLKDGTEYSMEQLKEDYFKELGDEGKEKLFPHGFTDGVLLECYDFVDAIENDREPDISAEMGLKSKSICESIFESGFCGQAVKYDDVVSGEIDAYQKPINEHWNL